MTGVHRTELLVTILSRGMHGREGGNGSKGGKEERRKGRGGNEGKVSEGWEEDNKRDGKHSETLQLSTATNSRFLVLQAFLTSTFTQ